MSAPPKVRPLAWRPAGADSAGASVEIVCPHCGERHLHGAADGWRAAHCAPRHPRETYEIVGTGEARTRFERGEPPCSADIRSDADFASALRQRAGWERIPARDLRRFVGALIGAEPDPAAIRRLSPAEFASRLADGRLLNAAVRDGCWRSPCPTAVELGEALRRRARNLPRSLPPRNPALSRAAGAEIRRAAKEGAR